MNNRLFYIDFIKVFAAFSVILLHIAAPFQYPIFIETIKELKLNYFYFNPLLSIPLLSISVFCFSFNSIFLLKKLPYINKIVPN